MGESISHSDAVARARAFAKEAHGQQRYGQEPYLLHLDAVADLLEPFGEVAQSVGYLHDVVEDTEVTLDEIQQQFGDYVAACVGLVTDEKGANRPARKAKTNAKLAAADERFALALVVKAADRLANLRVSVRGGVDSKLEVYRREHAEFRKAAFRAGLCDELWAEMDELLQTK